MRMMRMMMMWMERAGRCGPKVRWCVVKGGGKGAGGGGRGDQVGGDCG